MFDRRRKLDFHGSRVISDAGLLAHHELDDALDLSDVAWKGDFNGSLQPIQAKILLR